MQTLSRKNKSGGSYDVKESKYASSHKTLRDEESVSDSEDEDDSEVMDDDEGGQEGAPSDQGRNSIDIWNLRLELMHRLRQELRTHLGTHFLVVG